MHALLMFNRRELIRGAVGLISVPTLHRPRVTLDLVIGPSGEPGIVRAVLENVALEALTGIDASMMRTADRSSPPWFTMNLQPGKARLLLSTAPRKSVAAT